MMIQSFSIPLKLIRKRLLSTKKLKKNFHPYDRSTPLEPQVIREARDVGVSVFGPIKHLDEVEDHVVPGSGADVPLRVYIPANAV